MVNIARIIAKFRYRVIDLGVKISDRSVYSATRVPSNTGHYALLMIAVLISLSIMSIATGGGLVLLLFVGLASYALVPPALIIDMDNTRIKYGQEWNTERWVLRGFFFSPILPFIYLPLKFRRSNAEPIPPIKTKSIDRVNVDFSSAMNGESVDGEKLSDAVSSEKVLDHHSEYVINHASYACADVAEKEPNSLDPRVVPAMVDFLREADTSTEVGLKNATNAAVALSHLVDVQTERVGKHVGEIVSRIEIEDETVSESIMYVVWSLSEEDPVLLRDGIVPIVENAEEGTAESEFLLDLLWIVAAEEPDVLYPATENVIERLEEAEDGRENEDFSVLSVSIMQSISDKVMSESDDGFATAVASDINEEFDSEGVTEDTPEPEVERPEEGAEVELESASEPSLEQTKQDIGSGIDEEDEGKEP